MTRNKELREESGAVTYRDPLTSFFYQLMRDHLPAGTVEKLVQEIVDEPEECTFTNGWLAKYANNLSSVLQSAKTHKLKEDLDKVFAEIDLAKVNSKESGGEYELHDGGLIYKKKEAPSEEIEDSVLDGLKSKLEGIPQAEEKDVTEQIRDSLSELVEEGTISKEQAEELNKELEEIEEEVSEVCDGDCDDNCCKKTDKECCKGDEKDGRESESEDVQVEGTEVQ